MKTTCYTILISFIAVGCGVDFREGRNSKKGEQSADLHLSDSRSFAFTLPEDVNYKMPILPADHPQPGFVSIECASLALPPTDSIEENRPISDPQVKTTSPIQPIEVRAWLRVSLESIEGDVASKQTATLAYRCDGEAFLNLKGIKTIGTYVLQADVINHLDSTTYHGATKFLGTDQNVKLVMKRITNSGKRIEVIWDKDLPADQCKEEVACPDIYSPVVCNAVFLDAHGEKTEMSFDGPNACTAKVNAYIYKCKTEAQKLLDFNCNQVAF